MRQPGIALAVLLALVAVAPTASARELEIFLHELPDGRVHFLPEQLDANVGETLELAVYNSADATNGSAHNLVFCREPGDAAETCATPLARTGTIPPQGGEVLELRLTRGGTFSYFCEVGCPRIFRDPQSGIGAGVLRVAGDSADLEKDASPLPLLAPLGALAAVALWRRRP